MDLDKEFIKLQEEIEKLSRMRENTIAKNHKNVLDALRRRLAKFYEEHEVEGQLTFEIMAKYGRLKKLDKEIEKLIKDLYQGNSKLLNGLLRGITDEAYINTLGIVNKAAGARIKPIQKPVDVTKTVNMEMAGLKWAERMGKHRADVIWNIQKEIKQGLTQGDTYGTMTKRLKKELEVSTSKANAIVRTESSRVFAQSKKDSLDNIAKHGVKMVKKWVSSRDERVRSQHYEMDGVVVPYEEDFALPDGARAFSPGLTGLAHHDINCRCIMTVDIVRDGEAGGLPTNNDLFKPNEPIFVEKLDKVNYNIAKDKLIDYEKDIIDKDFENAYVITKDGEVYRFEGGKSTVNPARLGGKLKDSCMTHNHPSDETEYTFSDLDIKFFIENELKYLRGVDEKYTYELSKGLFEADKIPDLTIQQLNVENYHHIKIIERAKLANVSYRRRRHG